MKSPYMFIVMSFLATSFADNLKCNYCNQPVVSSISDINMSYKLCKFETAFSMISTTNPDWLFLGIECDDNCDNINQVNEGLYCHKDGTIGYYEIENGVLGNKINKLEFNEAECSFTDNESKLSVDRYMPNLWLRDQEITYYISSGLETLNLANKVPATFTIAYTDKDPIIVSGSSKNSIISLLTFSSLLAGVLLFF